MIETAFLAQLVARVRFPADAHARLFAAILAAVALAPVARPAQVEQLQTFAAAHFSEDLGLRHLAAAQKV
jgi:hypothetical protein